MLTLKMKNVCSHHRYLTAMLTFKLLMNSMFILQIQRRSFCKKACAPLRQQIGKIVRVLSQAVGKP